MVVVIPRKQLARGRSTFAVAEKDHRISAVARVIAGTPRIERQLNVLAPGIHTGADHITIRRHPAGLSGKMIVGNRFLPVKTAFVVRMYGPNLAAARLFNDKILAIKIFT